MNKNNTYKLSTATASILPFHIPIKKEQEQKRDNYTQTSDCNGSNTDSQSHCFIFVIDRQLITGFYRSDRDLFNKISNTLGSGNGQFNYPKGVAVDSSGNVYVVDYLNHRIQKFQSDGDFIRKWGHHCNMSIGQDCTDPDGTGPLSVGDGQFSYPWDIAVDSSANVYVADTGNNRIQKFTNTGDFITKWGSLGEGDGQLKIPIGVAIKSAEVSFVEERVFVADHHNWRIQVFKPELIIQP